MRPLLSQALTPGAVLISDGAIGTELQKLGLEPGGCGDEWNVTHPERVRALHHSYVAAGAQLITTNTFGSSRFVLARYGHEQRVREFSLAGARLARQAAGESGWVMGSVGPCGGFLEPLGELSVSALEDSLREQIAALLEGGADAILLETMTALDELEISVRIARQMKPACVIASLAYDRVRDGYRTMMGVAPEEAARTALAAGADVLGANCGTRLRPDDFAAIAQLYGRVTGLPILLQPNAGQPRLEGAEILYPLSPGDLANSLAQLTRHAQIVGGCCGCTPAHIRALRASLRQ